MNSSVYDSNGERIQAIDDMDSDSEDREPGLAAKMMSYKKYPINNMSILSGAMSSNKSAA